VDAIAFVKYDWKYDPELEQLATHLQGKNDDAPRWKEIGRNQPCPCGNGKKFKHSHGRKIG
jgi:preprotein translocase subunit SecA